MNSSMDEVVLLAQACKVPTLGQGPRLGTAPVRKIVDDEVAATRIRKALRRNTSLA